MAEARRRRQRLVHFTDIHFQAWPGSLQELIGKRLIGTLGLLLGRSAKFSEEEQHSVLMHAFADRREQLEASEEAQGVEYNRDIVIFTGDLTAMALPEEFAMAKKAFTEAMTRHIDDIDAPEDGVHAATPELFMIPGNHDLYTSQSESELTMWQHFDSFLHGNERGRTFLADLLETAADEVERVKAQLLQAGGAEDSRKAEVDNITLHLTDDVLIIGLNPCRANAVKSGGVYRAVQMAQLAAVIGSTEFGLRAREDELSDKFVVLTTHYPLLDEDNEPYHEQHPRHGVANGQLLLDALTHAVRAPDLVLHGHVHHHYKGSWAGIPIVCPNAAGQTYGKRGKRCSSFHVYEVESGGDRPRPRLVQAERWLAGKDGVYVKEELELGGGGDAEEEVQ